MKRFTSILLLAGNPGQAVAGRGVLLPGPLSTGQLCRRAPAGLVRHRESCRAESHDSVMESTRGVPVSVLQPDVMQGRVHWLRWQQDPLCSAIGLAAVTL